MRFDLAEVRLWLGILVGAFLATAGTHAQPAPAGSPPPGPPAPEELHLVFADPGAPPRTDLQTLATYDGAVLASVPEAEAAALAREGVRIRRIEDPTRIRVPGYDFDTRQGEPTLPQALRAKSTDGPAPHLVQFIGPLHPEWKDAIGRAGGTLARYGHVNNLAWVVLMDRESVTAVSQLPYVRWVGPFHPAYKLSEPLAEIGSREESSSDSDPITLLLQVFDRAQLQRTFEALSNLGGTTLSWGPSDPASTIQPFLTVEVDPSRLAELAGLPEVSWIQQRPHFELQTEQASHGMQSGTCSLTCDARTVDDVPWWRDGVTGAGPAPSCSATPGTEQIVGVLDSGIESHPDFESCPGPGCTVLAAESQLSSLGGSCGNAAPVSSCQDGHGHGTAVSGIIAGSGAASGGEQPIEACSAKGLAFGARLDVETCGPDLDCLNFCDGIATLDSFFQRTFDRGSRLSNHSWGADVQGDYDIYSQTVDTLAWDNNGAGPGTPQDYLWLVAAGNEGPSPGSLRSPGTAKDIVSVAAVYNGLDGGCWSCDTGACDTCDKVVCYSSRGPNDDGRHGPHIAGLSECITAPSFFDGYNDCFNGTSAATPTVTATAAQIREWWIHRQGVAAPSASLVKATLLNSGEPVQDPPTTIPDVHVGWGRVKLDNLWDSANPDLNVLWLDETSGLTTGGLTEFSVTIRSGNIPLRAMLVWTDYPAAAGVGGLVNDLDLLVREPADVACYRGNDATGNESNAVACTAPGVFDSLNNDEGVRVSSPAIGTWTIEVRATSVPQGPQSFALVVSGDLAQCEAPPPAPTGVGAVSGAPNSMTVSWNPVPEAIRYHVYRSDGACPGGQYQQIGTTLAPETSFTDSGLSGGSTYSYLVKALSADGCISEPSSCADGVATGDCTLPPAFSGLVGVVDDDSDPCGLTLSWDPATSSCPLFPALTYNVYRSLDPAFVPGPATLRASCVSGTSYSDDEVSDGVVYHYVVQAEDSRPSAGNGACHGGNQDANLVRASGSPTGNTYVPGTFHDDGGDTGPVQMIAEDPWYVTALKNNTAGGQFGYRAGDWGAPACASLRTPVLRLDPAASPTLTYWTAWDIQWIDDLGVVEISTDGGGSWAQLTPVPGYPDVGGQNTCVGPGTPGYGNVDYAAPSLDFSEYTIDLSAYTGQDVIVRFLYATDSQYNGQGWWLDDITITGILLPVACGNDSPACSAPPAFAGAGGVSRDASPNCGLTVAWDAAQSRCALAPGVTYSVYRGTAADFVPDASNRVASCLSGTSWSDSDVFFSLGYYYVVRAEDSSSGGGGPCNGGNEDPNEIRVGGTPGGPSVPGVFKADAGDLEPQQMLVPEDWSITDRHNNTPGVSQGFSYWASTTLPYPADMCSSLTTPPIDLGVGSVLSFYDIEALDYYLFGPDGGLVEVSVDGGHTWERLNDAATSTGWGYDYCSEAVYAAPMFSNWITYWDARQIPIPAALDNLTAQFRFRFVSNWRGGLSYLYEGWLLDDIQVDNVQAPTVCPNPDPACPVAPVFRGATGAVNDQASGTCSVTVSWDPAEVTCSAYAQNSYTVYRSTDAAFVPGPENMIATCVSGTSYTDTGVGYARPYYYAVRAEDSSTGGAGPCNGGTQDDNNRTAWVVPTGPAEVLGTWLDDAGDTYAPAMLVQPEWSITTYTNHTPYGSYSYQSVVEGASSYEGGVCSSITSPPLTLGTDSVLSFWAWPRMDSSWVDAGIIEVSNDGGITWTKVSPYSTYYNNYPATTPGGGNDCIGAFQRAFSGFNVFPDNWTQWFVPLGGYHPPYAPGTFPLFPGYSDQTVQIRFRFGSAGLPIPSGREGWFIDDIQVTNVWLPEGCQNSAAECADAPAFRGVTGVGTGTNPCSLTVDWNPGVAGCTSEPNVTYSLYKSRDPGFVPGPSSLLETCLPGPSFTDPDVSFDIPEYYVARAEDSRIDNTGSCNGGVEDVNVKRVVGIPQGPLGAVCLNSLPNCSDPPVFEGLQSVANNETDPCSITLTWAPADSRCLVGTGMTYSVHRSETQGFTPSWQNRIASCLTETSYTDTTVASDGDYYYVVRAEDTSTNGSGPCNSGNIDPNALEAAVTPSGSVGTLFFDDFESGLGNWTATDLWGISSAQAQSGLQSASSGFDWGLCESLTLNDPVALPADAGTAFLSFWTMLTLAGTGPLGYNLGIVEISADDGPWVKIEPVGGYPDYSQGFTDACTGILEAGFSVNPDTWTRYEFDLAAYRGSSVRIRLLLGTSSDQYAENTWYVDDVEIRYGGSCVASCPSLPSTPASVTATPTASETVSLDWTAVDGAVRYDIYRGPGSCPGTGFVKIATVDAPATTYLDESAGGGGSWSYQVIVENAAGCRSGASICVDAAIAGGCTRAPTFAGLEAADNGQVDPCGIRLSWESAIDNCPLSTGVRYSVYRGTSEGFTPGPATLLASCVSGTSFDDHTVDHGTRYSYVVRAEGSPGGGGGPCSGGHQEANFVERTAAASGALVPGTFVDSAGDGYPQRMILEAPWNLGLDRAYGGSVSYHAGESVNGCASMTTPPLHLDPWVPAEISFWSSYNTLNEGRSGGMVDISNDGGATWTPLPLTPDYTDINNQVTCLPFTGETFAGYAASWTRHAAALDDYTGQQVIVRFHYGTLDPNDIRTGWYVDDIRVTNVVSEDTCRNPSPACDVPPFFIGVDSVTDNGTATCGITVAWDPASSACSQYPDLVYNVYRGTDPDFVPGPSNLVASCLETTSYSDPDVIRQNTYYYVVRAEDRRPGGGGGTCGVGREDANIVRLGASPSKNPPVLGNWFDDAGDTQPAKMITNPLWHVATGNAHSGTASYFAPEDVDRCDNLLTPPLSLAEGSMLSFWSWISTVYDSWPYAAGTIDITNDGGVSWTRLTPIGGYPEYYNSNILCDIAWEDCFTYEEPWTAYTVDLSAYANQTVQVRFHFSSHNFGVNPSIGWRIDDIGVTNVWMPGNCTKQFGCTLAVDVVPDSAAAVCAGDGITFSAAVTGGAGPYTYQWTEDGVDIPGATGISHTVSRGDAGSHAYNCNVTDGSPTCGVRTDPTSSTGEWTELCAPNVVFDVSFDPASTLAQVCGDGDAIVEPGERWSSYASLANAGNAPAGEVRAGLAVSAASTADANVLTDAASFGTIAPGLKAMNLTDRFQFCPAETAACGAAVSFDVTDIHWSGGGTPPNGQASAFAIPVGIADPGGGEWADLTPADPITASFGATVSDLAPVTIDSPDTAVLAYGYSYSPPRATIFETGFDTLVEWNRVGAMTEPVDIDTCPESDGGSNVRISGSGWIQKNFPHQHSQVRMEFDHFSGVELDPGEFLLVQYKMTSVPDWTPVFQGPDGGDDLWYCDETIDFPDLGDTSVSIRFDNNANAAGEYVRLDNFRLTGITSGTWTDTVKVELQDTMGSWHVLKDYGEADANPYDLIALNIYTGPGTYRIRLSESAGANAELSTAAPTEGLHVVRSPRLECDVSPCCGATTGPPPVGDGWLAGGEAVTMSTDGVNMTYDHDAVTCSDVTAVVVYGNMGDYSRYVGVADCDGDGTFDATGLDNVWFNVIWVDATGGAGHPGYDSSGSRNLGAAGLGCAIVEDRKGDGRCD